MPLKPVSKVQSLYIQHSLNSTLRNNHETWLNRLDIGHWTLDFGLWTLGLIVTHTEDLDLKSNASDVMLCAFALADCVVHVDAQIAKYLRAVHRTALELAVPNLFGLEVGGYWLTTAQINQLRKLPDCYTANEIDLVRRAVESYLLAQTEGLGSISESERGQAASGSSR